MTWDSFCLSQSSHIKRLYELTHRTQLNLKAPVTFNEKLWWLKIHDSTYQKAYCADKVNIPCISAKIGILGINHPLVVLDDPHKIAFSKLPEAFVIKCNHGSGMNIIVSDKNKLNHKATITQLTQWLNIKYGNVWGELYYNLIKPKIIIEPVLHDDQYTSLTDYKIYCFNGIPRFIQVITDRLAHECISHYTTDWKYTTMYDQVGYKSIDTIKPPSCLQNILQYASQLSQPFKFVRADFYIVNCTPYLSELTFIPNAGNIKYKNPDADVYLGRMLQLH